MWTHRIVGGVPAVPGIALLAAQLTLPGTAVHHVRRAAAAVLPPRA